ILASMSMPQISTVRQDITRKGEVAAQVAMDAIKSDEKQYICLPLTVVQRGSTGPKSSRKETVL
ncbi:MAG TPA: substrate-binding domain-containing protein, partial [Clostridia bacterium]|nr:substrate-binding domain-containing protein [Clostridia bacterium]